VYIEIKFYYFSLYESVAIFHPNQIQLCFLAPPIKNKTKKDRNHMENIGSIVSRDEIHYFTQQLRELKSGNISEDDFTAIRLQQGIYGQRQDGTYMVRIKVPGGALTVDQLAGIGELIENFADIDYGSITTRQDIQLHFVSLENIPSVLSKLADIGLTTREACGNTVRNVTACHSAGCCDKEITDVRPFLQKTVSHFLRHPLAQHLPRKFKMSFSGCEMDCAYGMIHDVGVVARQLDGKKGFKVLAAGGLGHKPREALVLEEFVEEDKLLAVIEALITLHNRYSDRTKRARSRMKFLVARFGEEDFIKKYREILQTAETKISSFQVQEQESEQLGWQKIDFTNKKATNNKVTLRLPLGDLSLTNINNLVACMHQFGLSELRTTQSQNLMLTNIYADEQQFVEQQLKEYGFDISEAKQNVVACPGSWTCRLGITGSRDLATKLADEADDVKIHISGCHNGCAQPQLSDIGLHGEGRRLFGRLIPFYRLYLGGSGFGDGALALKGPEVPAARVDQTIVLIKKAFSEDKTTDESFTAWVQRKDAAYFADLLSLITKVSAEDLPVLLKDVGQEDDFRVLQLGGGECAGISEETVAAQLKEAEYEKNYRDIFVHQSKYEEALDCAENLLRLVGKSLLFKKGELVGEDLQDILSLLSTSYSNRVAVVDGFKSLIEKGKELRDSSDKLAYQTYSQEMDSWVAHAVNDAEDIYAASNTTIETVLDLTGEVCPMHYIKARKALAGIEQGQILRILLNTGEDTRVVSKSLQSTGFEIVEKHENDEASTTTLHVLKPAPVTEKVSTEKRTEQVA